MSKTPTKRRLSVRITPVETKNAHVSFYFSPDEILAALAVHRGLPLPAGAYKANVFSGFGGDTVAVSVELLQEQPDYLAKVRAVTR